MIDIYEMTINELLETYPFVSEFFSMNRLDVSGKEALKFEEFISLLSPEEAQDAALDTDRLMEELNDFINQMSEFLGTGRAVETLTILPGKTKSGNAEGFERLDIKPGEIISIVGPTGSGKSRLLADIEWAANGDTPTGRYILINGKAPDMKWRYSPGSKLVAQLSQNMNFVMDLSVWDFLLLHAKSRLVADADALCEKILEEANLLAGEPFSKDAPVTGLSGGQSRALMIADTASLSGAPIVLIDEIENAGIDRGKALNLLVGNEKIVLMATHDPLLALMAHKRIVIKNGGIQAVLETNEAELKTLEKIKELDAFLRETRQSLREGKRLV